jgi:hypothetical protein
MSRQRSGWRRANPVKAAIRKASYNAEHRALRAQLLAALIPGAPCPQVFPDGTRCGRPMYAEQVLHLGHNADRSGYIGLVHKGCNLRAAAMMSNLKAGRPAIARPKPPLPKGRRPW